MSETINLERFEAKSFMGIDKSKPVIIDFTKRKKNQKIVELVGDEALCKTSTICGILYAMGAAFDINKKQLFNTTDDKLDVNLKFSYDGAKYEVVVADDRISLKKYDEDAEKWKKEDEPVATLKKIFGPVGLSPFALRTMRGKDQIEYIQELFGSGEDTKKKHRQIESDYDDLFAKRRDVNREIKNLKGALAAEPLFVNYEQSQEAFKTPIAADKEKAAYEEIAKKNREYLNYKENVLPSKKSALVSKQREIAELEQRLAAAKKEEKDISAAVEKAEKWVDDNKGVPAQFKKADIDWMNLSNKLADQRKWTDVLQKEKDLKALEKASEKATSQLDDLDLQMLKLTSSYLPKIPGLKLKVRPSIDKDKEEVGLFFNDFTMAQLNESEFAKLWAQIFIEKEMSFLFFENLNSYGSGAIAVINELAKEDGVLVFGTRMERKQKHLEINFNSKVE